jgi:hypothetical protein
MQRRNYRTWKALFYFFLKQSVVNAFRLCQWQGLPDDEEFDEDDPLTGQSDDHRRFREALITKLWSYKGQIGAYAPEAAIHEKERRKTKDQRCVQCRAAGFGRNAAKRQPLALTLGNLPPPSRTRWGCKQCQVPLCKKGDCWAKFHSN